MAWERVKIFNSIALFFMPPLRDVSLPPIVTVDASNASTPAPEGSSPTPEHDLAHLRALRLRRFAPAASASVAALPSTPAFAAAPPSTSAFVAASVPAPVLGVAPSVPVPASLVARPVVVSHLSAFFPSSGTLIRFNFTPRLLILYRFQTLDRKRRLRAFLFVSLPVHVPWCRLHCLKHLSFQPPLRARTS